MLTSLHIENLRGIERLDIEGLGRVNIIVGRNDVGKTTVLGAAGLQESAAAWTFLVPHLGDLHQDVTDLELVWLPIFRNGDVSRHPTVWGTDDGVETGWRLELSKSKGGRPGWPLLFRRVQSLDEIVEILPDAVDNAGTTEGPASWWSPGSIEPEDNIFEPIKELYLAGQMGSLLAALQHVNPRITAVEPVGEHLYVRLDGVPLPLPYTILGDGARRLLEFALAVASAEGHPTGARILVDEAENGFHWSTLRTVWELFRAAPPDIQIFATTHRDELVRIACEVFRDAGDDGLRIIRLDRTDEGHRAVVYTAEVALAALDSGLEIRG